MTTNPHAQTIQHSKISITRREANSSRIIIVRLYSYSAHYLGRIIFLPQQQKHTVFLLSPPYCPRQASIHFARLPFCSWKIITLRFIFVFSLFLEVKVVFMTWRFGLRFSWFTVHGYGSIYGQASVRSGIATS